MLQKIREKTSGPIATAILVLIVFVMAFFGIEQYNMQHVENYAARIQAPPTWWKSAPSWWPASMLWQREEISTDDFRGRFEQVRQQQRAAQGDRFDPRGFESLENKRGVLDSMIDERVLAMAAQRQGIAVSDARVQQAIAAIPAFQVDGKFNAERYQLALASQFPPRTPRQFEQVVRESLEQSLVPSAIASSAVVAPGEMERLLKLLGETRDVSFVMLPPPSADTGAVSGKEIQRWYREHASDFRAPETVSLEYVEVDASALPEPAQPDDATLKQRYEQEKARFVEPEQRLASHILVKVDAGADDAAWKAAQAKAAALAGKARQPGADFAALARAESDDSGSKAGGGDLGWVEKGAMVKPFEDALFAMKAGEVSDPVRSEFGWHVIQLREVKTGKQVPFEQARPELLREQVEADRERAFNDLTGRLVDIVYKNPSSLGPAARELNLPIRKLGPVSRSDDSGILAIPAVKRAAFSEALVQDGTVSDPIEAGPGKSVLLRVVQHTPESAQPLAKVRDRVVAEIRADRATRAATARADAMLAQLRAGKSMKEVAEAQQLGAIDLPSIPRGAPAPDQAAGEAYFGVPAPAPGKVSAGKVKLDNGATVVFAVSKVTPGDPAKASESERDGLRRQLEQLRGGDAAAEYIKALRRQVVIKVVDERL